MVGYDGKLLQYSQQIGGPDGKWQGAANSRDMNTLSAAPAINVRPVIGGTEISVRYITRANERSQLRAKLNHAAVDLLGQGLAPQPASDSLKPSLTST